ncbi:hypothetical protein H3C61_03430 [Candidatus Gracilibacteria bacterium]|nr:hypothetical protein [Candidatus Gracilibacteria bacterium]
MSTAIQTEEDLLIIGDTDNDIIDFDFPSNTTSSSIDNSLEIIDSPKVDEVSFDLGGFDLLGGSEVENEKKEETSLAGTSLAADNNTVDIDFGFGETSLTEEKTDLALEAIKQEEVLEDLNLEGKQEDLFDLTSNKEEVTLNNLTTFGESKEEVEKEVTPAKEEQIFDRNSILDETISKIQQRKDFISKTIEQKEDSASILDKKIAKLKEELSFLKKEVKDLEIEDGALDLDIANIEKMKKSVLETDSTRTREHKLGNIKK